MSTRLHTTRIYPDARNMDKFWTVPYSNGKRIIELKRTKPEVRKGKPGQPLDCMNALCVMDHKRQLPHPVHMAAFLKTACYLVDKMKNGVPVHAMRYDHNDHYHITAHDSPGGKTQLIRAGILNKTLRLRPPRQTAHGSGPSIRTGRRNKATLAPSSLRRAVEAGILPA